MIFVHFFLIKAFFIGPKFFPVRGGVVIVLIQLSIFNLTCLVLSWFSASDLPRSEPASVLFVS